MKMVVESYITGFNEFLRDQDKTDRLTLVLFEDECLIPLDCIPVQEATRSNPQPTSRAARPSP